MLEKKHTINLENYSRRNNVVIRGKSENSSESNVECEEKTRKFMINELRLDDDKRIHNVDQLSFDKINDNSLFISESFSAESEFNRKKNILSINMQSLWKSTKQRIRYTVDNLNELPADLSLRHFCEKLSGSFFVFGGIVNQMVTHSGALNKPTNSVRLFTVALRRLRSSYSTQPILTDPRN